MKRQAAPVSLGSCNIESSPCGSSIHSSDMVAHSGRVKETLAFDPSAISKAVASSALKAISAMQVADAATGRTALASSTRAQPPSLKCSQTDEDRPNAVNATASLLNSRAGDDADKDASLGVVVTLNGNASAAPHLVYPSNTCCSRMPSTSPRTATALGNPQLLMSRPFDRFQETFPVTVSRRKFGKWISAALPPRPRHCCALQHCLISGGTMSWTSAFRQFPHHPTFSVARIPMECARTPIDLAAAWCLLSTLLWRQISCARCVRRGEVHKLPEALVGGKSFLAALAITRPSLIVDARSSPRSRTLDRRSQGMAFEKRLMHTACGFRRGLCPTCDCTGDLDQISLAFFFHISHRSGTLPTCPASV